MSVVVFPLSPPCWRPELHLSLQRFRLGHHSEGFTSWCPLVSARWVMVPPCTMNATIGRRSKVLRMAVDFDQRGPFAVVKINRPEARNAVNGAVAHGIEEAIDKIEADDDIWVGILTGEPPVFCAGADLKEINSGNAGALQTERGGFGGIVAARAHQADHRRGRRAGPRRRHRDRPVLRPGRRLDLGHLRHPRGEAIAGRRSRRAVPPAPQDPVQRRHGAGAHRRPHHR